MSFNPQLTPRKQIRNLLVVLFAGFLSAIILTLLMLYNYGPQGDYLIKNALLSPSVIAKMSLNEKNQKNDSPLLDKIEFSFQEAETHKTFHLPIDKNKYALFYTTVVNDKSLTEVPTEITAAFNQTPYASLTIMVQNQNYKNASDKNQLFQELQLLYKGDYYRLKLRDATGTNWIYFYHPRIYENALTLLRA